MLSLARAITSMRRVTGVEFLEGSAEALPLPDRSATVLWALSSVHHWVDRGAGLAEAHRVLVPGGWILLAERAVAPGARGHARHGLTSEESEVLIEAVKQVEHGQMPARPENLYGI